MIYDEKTKTFTVSESEFNIFENDMTGWCIECGEEHDSCVEPDARRYPCSNCKKQGVFGVEQLLLEGRLDFFDGTEEEEEEDFDDQGQKKKSKADPDQIAERRAMGLDQHGERLDAPTYCNDDPYDQPDGPDFEYDEDPEEEEGEEE